MYSIAILDSHLITGNFSGGGLINAQTLLTKFPSRYSVIYLPKSNVYYAIKENPKLLKNMDKIESAGLVVSKTFKELWTSERRRSFRAYRKKLLEGYDSEIREVDFAYDNDFYNTLLPFPGINADILEMCRNTKVSKFGITLRGYSDISDSNNLGLIKLILRNELSSILDTETLKRYMSFLIHPLFNRHVNRCISRYESLKFIAVVNRHLAHQNSEMSKDNGKFRLLFPSDVSQFRLESGLKPLKNQLDIFFYSRLVPEKGIFEIPKILMEIRKLGNDVNLKVAGKFMYQRDEQAFHRLLNKYGVKEYVNILGFLNEEDLKNVLASSKVLMYPSHSDSFSIAILNSIHMKIKVVAYDLPSLKDIYGKIPTVKFVKEYETKAMALAISDILKENESSYFDSFNNPQTIQFLESTSNPGRLFDAISELIDESVSISHKEL